MSGARVTEVRPVLLSHVYEPSAALEWIGGRIESWDAALVQVTLDDGTTGLGEVAQGIMGAAAVPGIVDVLRHQIVGTTIVDHRSVGDDLRDRNVFWGRGAIVSGVIGAVETAALDALAKRQGVPAYELLGGLQHRRVEAYASGGLGRDVREIAEWIRAQQHAGFATVKFRAQRTPDDTIALLEQLAPLFEDGGRFVLDAVQGCARRGWSADEAIRVGSALEGLGARWFEEPCRAEDVDGYRAVRAATQVPVSGVESYASRHDFDHLVRAEGVDIVQPDVAMVGGPTEFQRVAAMAAAHDLLCVPHIWGTAVTLTANLHTVLATPSTTLVEWCTLPNPLREALLVEPLQVVDGEALAPTVPGLGVELTPEVEDRYPFVPGRGHVIT